MSSLALNSPRTMIVFPISVGRSISFLRCVSRTAQLASPVPSPRGWECSCTKNFSRCAFVRRRRFALRDHRYRRQPLQRLGFGNGRSNTISPPTIVRTASGPRISSGAMVAMSRERTARSGVLAGSQDTRPDFLKRRISGVEGVAAQRLFPGQALGGIPAVARAALRILPRHRGVHAHERAESCGAFPRSADQTGSGGGSVRQACAVAIRSGPMRFRPTPCRACTGSTAATRGPPARRNGAHPPAGGRSHARSGCDGP